MSGMNSANANKRWLTAVRPKDLSKLYRAAMDAGCECSPGRNHHVKVKAPNGASFDGPLTGNSNSLRVVRAKFKRYANLEL